MNKNNQPSKQTNKQTEKQHEKKKHIWELALLKY